MKSAESVLIRHLILRAAPLCFALCALLAAPGARAAAIPAPDFTGADSWLNTDHDRPISIGDLRGQVVVLDFWTYCCINCMHVFPDLHYIERKYAGRPVVVIGIHSGKFDQEKDADHIRQAILRNDITHPVAVDSDYRIWNAYGVEGWPTLVVIDPRGNIAAAWSGEGHRAQLDAEVADLLRAGREQGTLAKPMSFRPEAASFRPGTLEFPGKVLADAAGGRLFISDTSHDRVLVCDLDGKVERVIGGASGLKDGPFQDAAFHHPQGTALSADGRTLYIADTENHAIRAADLTAGVVTTIAGDGTQARDFPEDSPAKTSRLSSPWDLARVGHQLYIAMAGVHQIWAMDLRRGTLRVFAGTGREGAADGPDADAGFAQPSGLTTDGRSLYIADSEDSSVRKISLADSLTTTVAGSEDLFGFGRQDGVGSTARFQHPLGVALDGDSLFVADTFNGLIRVIDLKTRDVRTWLGSGATDIGTADAPNLYEPGGLSVAGQTLFIADTNHHRILAVDIPTKHAHVLQIRLPH